MAAKGRFAAPVISRRPVRLIRVRRTSCVIIALAGALAAGCGARALSSDAGSPARPPASGAGLGGATASDAGSAPDTGVGGTTSGAAGTAGTFGTAGSLGTAGTIGAVDTRPPTCVEGTNSCADAQTAAICSGGVIQTFSCPMGCFDGVCAECVPGSTTCETENAVQTCGPDGIWQPAQTCDALCVNGACGTCVEGSTRCASHESQQTCKGGRWTAVADCEFVCVGDACGKNVRRVFVTSQAFVAGELGGLTGADDICQKLAISAGLSRSYAAWLSDETGSPVTRFPKDAGPYVLFDGTVVANNWTDLTSGVLRHPIDLNEWGGPPAQGSGNITPFAIWTDTSANGTLSTTFPGDGSCSRWSDPTGMNVVFGSYQFATGNWSELGAEGSGAGTTPAICENSAALYCFEQ